MTEIIKYEDYIVKDTSNSELSSSIAVAVATNKTTSAELSKVERNTNGNDNRLIETTSESNNILQHYDNTFTLSKLVTNLQDCQTSYWIDYMYSNVLERTVLKPRLNTCGERCCTHKQCVDARIKRIKEILKPWFQAHEKRKIRHIILTTREIPEKDLTKQRIKEIRKKMHWFLRRLNRTNQAYKGFYVAEYKFDPSRKTYKIHFHMANFNIVHKEATLAQWWAMLNKGVKTPNQLNPEDYLKVKVNYKANQEAVLNYLAKRSAMAGMVDVGKQRPFSIPSYKDTKRGRGSPNYYISLDPISYLNFVKGSRLVEKYGTFSKGVLHCVYQLSQEIKKNQDLELIFTVGKISRSEYPEIPPDFLNAEEFEQIARDLLQSELAEIHTNKAIYRMAFRQLVADNEVTAKRSMMAKKTKTKQLKLNKFMWW